MHRIFFLVLTLSTGLTAQIQNADFESPQRPGSLPLGVWRVLEGRPRIEPGNGLLGAFTDGGFPTSGSQWLRVSNAFTGPTVLAVPSDPALGIHGPGQVCEVRQSFVPDGTGVISFDWTFVTGEGTPPGAWNDFASIDVIDPALNQHLVNLLFVDAGGGGTTLNVPGAQGGSAGPTSFAPSATQFPGREVLPLGPKRATVAVPMLQPGQTYELVIVAGNLADASVTSFLYLDALSGTAAPPVTHQRNSPEASLELSGTSCQPPGDWPERRLAPADDVVTMTVRSFATGATPYALFATAGVGATPGAGIGTVAGFVDLDPAALAPAPAGPLVLIVNGISGTSLLDLLLGSTDPTGSVALPLSIPLGASGIVGTFQALCLDPGAPFGSTLTGATQLEVAPPNPLSITVQGLVDLGLGDEDVVNLALGGLSLPFYGATYTNLWIGANGYVSFLNPVFEPQENTLGLRTGPPRIAAYWDDLDPGSGGAVAFSETPNELLVSWVGVPERGRTTTASFALRMTPAGTIELRYGPMQAKDGLVGIVPGIGSPVGPTANYGSDLSLAALTGLTGGPADGFFEWFFFGRFDLDHCLPAGPGGPLSFQPNPGPGVPGAQGYTMF